MTVRRRSLLAALGGVLILGLPHATFALVGFQPRGLLRAKPADAALRLKGGPRRSRVVRWALAAKGDKAPRGPVARSVSDATLLRSRIDSLRSNIVRQRREVAALEKILLACDSKGNAAQLAEAQEKLAVLPPPPMSPWRASARVLLRRLSENSDPLDYLTRQTTTALRVGVQLATNGQLMRDVLPNAPLLAAHATGIYSRLSQLETHVPGIMGVLSGYLPVLEPHLDAIMERFDDIEPHLPFVLDNIDVLAPHCGALIRHIDELLLYADEDEVWAEGLLPFVGYFSSRLDALGPHLPLLRPHLPRLLPFLPRLAPHVDRFAPYTCVSQNADVLLWWWGWALRIPLVHWVFAVPGVPRLCAWLSRRLPRRPVRGECHFVECDVGDLYSNPNSRWNRLGLSMRGSSSAADAAPRGAANAADGDGDDASDLVLADRAASRLFAATSSRVMDGVLAAGNAAASWSSSSAAPKKPAAAE